MAYAWTGNQRPPLNSLKLNREYPLLGDYQEWANLPIGERIHCHNFTIWNHESVQVLGLLEKGLTSTGETTLYPPFIRWNPANETVESNKDGS